MTGIYEHRLVAGRREIFWNSERGERRLVAIVDAAADPSIAASIEAEHAARVRDMEARSEGTDR